MESTGRTAGALLRLPQFSPGEKALHLVKRILLKQHGVLWYSEPVFEFSARIMPAFHGVKCGSYTDFKDKRQFFFLTPSAISFSQGVLRPIL